MFSSARAWLTPTERAAEKGSSMKRIRTLTCCVIFFCFPAFAAFAQVAESSAADQSVTANNTAAAAAVATGRIQPVHTPDFLEHLVDAVLSAFNVPNSGNTAIHYIISALILVCAFMLRRVVTAIFFSFLKKLASRTETTLDDKLFPVLEGPLAAFISIVGFFAALRVLKLSPQADEVIGQGSTVAFSLVIFWGLLRAFNALLDHGHELALKKQMGIAAFMPWIKKTLVAIFVVIGLLQVVQSLGYDVKAILGAAGIGGLAFALAAQDTIANLFGSLVVATDQPFKIGETISVGGNTGTVEDIGLRSTKIRLVDRSLIIIPNKTVASESITNLSRFTQRRVEMTVGLTYDATASQMETVVEDIRQLILAETEIDPDSVVVQFNNFGASSLDILIVFVCRDPNYAKHLKLKQRILLAIMRQVETRGLAFAFPTQTVVLDGPVAKQLVGQKS